MFALRQRESSKPRRRSASRGLTSCRRSAPESALRISALSSRRLTVNTTQAQTNWVSRWPGNSIFGESTAAPLKRRGPICWRQNGRTEAVISTLVSDVATAYFQLRALDWQLEISRRTLASRQDSLRLTQMLANGGATSMLDVRQAEQLVFTAAETIPDLERHIEQQENFLSTLLGKNPGPIARGTKLTEQPHVPEIPAGLPSSLLERRPDIREAEAQLIAANAQIGVAKAAYFPQISLTATSGFQSSALTSLFTSPAGLWSFGGSLVQPAFTGGRIRSGVKFAEARQQEALLIYQQTIQQAFRGVSDALIGYQKDWEFRQQQQRLALSAQDAARLSEMRYQGGAASYLEVLTNETNYFAAELGLAQAQLNELLGLVRIYRNLGGGWQQ